MTALCCVSGCQRPRRVSVDGNSYTRCADHVSRLQTAAFARDPGERRNPSPTLLEAAVAVPAVAVLT